MNHIHRHDQNLNLLKQYTTYENKNVNSTFVRIYVDRYLGTKRLR